ncbi:VOC family protein [soil metagenome]
MSTKIFVNLPVKDLSRSMDFFKKLGYTFNPQFTDETAACMVISEDIFAMLLTEAKFKIFTPKDIADSTKSTEVITCLSAESKDNVNEIVDKALQAGGTETRESQDYGFMFGRSFNDLDGHIWEIMWMDMSALPEHMNSK